MKKSIIILMMSLLSVIGNAQAGDSAATKYPFVFVHGIFGFDDIWGIDYFYGIPQALREEGAQVYLAQVSPANSTEFRGEQLRTFIQAVLLDSGAEKVNIIGHSHGGPTARYVASVSPDLVASVTSVGGVNWGSRFADVMRGLVEEDSVTEDLIRQGLNALAHVITGLSEGEVLPEDSLAMTESLTTPGSIAFNSQYPEGMPSSYCGDGEKIAGNGVYYYSWSGAQPFTHLVDPLDYALQLTSLVFDEKNDGLVSSCSSHLGKVIKDDYYMNHLDEVNQAFGLTSWFETDPVTLYRQHANRLKQAGL
ncbi:lipase family alpha/beta hydrolase [Thalassomonas actiniarum]|uniref:Triacylglycerol lipase n=1 Tax=Thalassomonas actiniarum TaxID=485447 RepID=A0AAF0C2J4_9GAMM|nr:triacylglycerol lipase [Thalassomonas actiniarum]WDE00207.1 triacylglycerol lipase [Thalassomonas actiniarum]